MCVYVSILSIYKYTHQVCSKFKNSCQAIEHMTNVSLINYFIHTISWRFHIGKVANTDFTAFLNIKE